MTCSGSSRRCRHHSRFPMCSPNRWFRRTISKLLPIMSTSLSRTSRLCSARSTLEKCDFQLRSRRSNGTISAERVGQIVVEIGKKASVVVNRDNDGNVKYASAHDLRRSFGERWAAKVMPQILMELMRHEDIKTTMRFYVGRNAQRTADILWDIHSKISDCGNTSGNTSSKTADSPAV